MKVKTNILNGVALDWAVAQCENENVSMVRGQLEAQWTDNGWRPSADWAQGGTIIEHERITLDYNPIKSKGRPWTATMPSGAEEQGATPLIAAMRAYVSSVFGDDVDIPEDLL
jgi:hypothetical protein